MVKKNKIYFLLDEKGYDSVKHLPKNVHTEKQVCSVVLFL